LVVGRARQAHQRHGHIHPHRADGGVIARTHARARIDFSRKGRAGSGLSGIDKGGGAPVLADALAQFHRRGIHRLGADRRIVGELRSQRL